MRDAFGAARAQGQMALQNVEELWPMVSFPLYIFVSMAVLSHAGRPDLAGNALVAAMLTCIVQMAFFIGGRMVAVDRDLQVLELIVASPARYGATLAARILFLIGIGLFTLGEAWLITRFVFGIAVPVPHPWLLLVSLVFTAAATTAAATLASALFGLGRNANTFQNAVNGPLYLLGGVLVPVTYLPPWLQVFSPFIFLTWSANLLRGALKPGPHAGAALELGALVALTVVTAVIAAVVIRRMMLALRRDGAMGLV
jgi:ABC-2 type transport system permease protein